MLKARTEGSVMEMSQTLEKLNDLDDTLLSRDERIYAAASDYEETLSPDKLFDFISELMGSFSGFLTLRR
jgi:hypothetical protein